MNSIASESDSEQDQILSKEKQDEIKHQNISTDPPSLNIPNMNDSSGGDQINSRDSLRIQQESKRSSFLISNTRKLQILKQMHLMSSEELYEVCLQILQKSSAERNHFDLQILQKTFSQIQFFQKFEEQSGQSALLTLYKRLELETYDIHDLAIQQGTRGDKFYIILQGSVGVFIKPAALPPPAHVELNENTHNESVNSTQKQSEIKRLNSQVQNISQQSQTAIPNQSFSIGNRNSPSPFMRQQSPVLSTKNNTSTQINNSSLKFEQTSNRNRSDSGKDHNLNNPSLNIPTITFISSDTVLQEQGPASLIIDRSSMIQQKQEGSIHINQQQSLKQKSNLKGSANQNLKQAQINKSLNATLIAQQNLNQQINSSQQKSVQQQSEQNLPMNQIDDFEGNASLKKTNILSTKNEKSTDKTSNNDKMTNSVASSQLKSAKAFQDNQVFTFLNILQNKQMKDRVIFPPHEQRNWQKVNQLQAGQSFGELALLNDAPRMANVVCNSICHFAVLNKKDFKEVVASVESQKIKGYIQFLQQVPGFDKISRRALNMIVFSLEIKTFTFRDLIYKEKQKSDHLYIVKEGEFCLQQSVDYQPPKDPAHYNYEDFNNKYKPANQNKAIRKAQIAVLSKGELFGDYEVFAEKPRCMDAICNSQKGENLLNRCEILNDKELLANLKQNSQQKHGIHEKMVKYIHGTSSSFQNMLVNNQKLIADQRNTDCINVNRSQSNSKKRIQTINQKGQQIPTQPTTQAATQQLKESLYEPAFLTQNLQNLPRGKSAPSTARHRQIVKPSYNQLIEENTSQIQQIQDNSQNEAHRSSLNSALMPQLFSDQIQELNGSFTERSSGYIQQMKQPIKKLDGEINNNNAQNYEFSASQERVGYSRQVPKINMSFIKPYTPLNQNTSRPQSSERSNFAPTTTARSRYNNPFIQTDTPFIQIQNQSTAGSPKKKQVEDSQLNDLSKSLALNKQNQRQLYAKIEKQLQQKKQNLDKSMDSFANNSQQESASSSTILLFNNNNNTPITSVVRKRIHQQKEEKQDFEKDLKSENMIKAKQMILRQLNSQAIKQRQIVNKSVDIQSNSSVVSTSALTTNKAVDASFKPNLAFSKLQINPHVDYSETRKQVLRKMRKFKQIDYLNEMKKTKQLDQEKLNNEFSRIHTIRNKAYVVINPHAFINFVNIS